MISQADEVYISSVSIWESAIKIKIGKLEADMEELMQEVTASGFLELPLTMKHVAQVSQLLDVHRDPFDRVLIAQAIAEPLKFLTSDAKLKAYSDLVEMV